ncbi:MerR family transcriptional regulator [Lysinibacillus endophyticus]|uniref:MerR family transcriptional regulator n=1 Tax=Ureibacillus endophyticus TaxID=1978490 RepID=UPI0020A0678C|nr:MerR family transcriptional regulator [Lysinibacillus endophyticus]MCP1146575.1 MerR family transcriptional regulator [Lysinibacillus endophyticus]
MKEHLSIGEFAKRTGVSIRTLHYYDELGLLTPLRTESGRRVYNNTHFVTMQKIVTLKFLGFSLEQMKNLIQQNDWSVKQSLEFQKKLMEEKLSQIQKVINALDHKSILLMNRMQSMQVFLPRLFKGYNYRTNIKNG